MSWSSMVLYQVGESSRRLRTSSDVYKRQRYAERYPDNATYAKLANQDVSATLTVVGTSGQNSPEVTACLLYTSRCV